MFNIVVLLKLCISLLYQSISIFAPYLHSGVMRAKIEHRGLLLNNIVDCYGTL